MNYGLLIFKWLWRDGRAGELTILAGALLVAVTSSTAIALFADRLQRTMTAQTADFLAADLVIASPEPIPAEWRRQADALGLAQAQTTEFSSVLMEHDELLLAAVKAVSAAYPLRGFLKVTANDYSHEEIVNSGPPAGHAWVEKRVLSALHLKPGDLLTVGEKALTISKILTYETDKKGDFYSFSPRVMINEANLAATGIIQPGSHVHYFFQYKGDNADLEAFNRWLKPRLNPSQRVLDIHHDRPELGSVLSRAERYLGLSNIVVTLLAGVAIAMTARRYSERHFNAVALLRCMGLKQQSILLLFCCQFLILGIAISVLGCLLGWAAQYGLFYLLKNVLPPHTAAPGWQPFLLGFGTGLAILFAYSLPPLLRLKHVSPLRVLRRDLEPLPIRAFWVYGLALVLAFVLIVQYTQDFMLTFSILGIGSVVIAALILLIYGLLNVVAKSRMQLPLTVRFALQGLLRNKKATAVQILAFTLTASAMVLSFSVRNGLIEKWRQQLPEQAPNHFALNIFPQQQEAFQEFLHAHHIEHSRFYPIIRGRLVEINGTSVQRIDIKDGQGENAIHRELSLTWADQLPEDNRITEGTWPLTPTPGMVSVEQKLADSLRIKVGDRLRFTIGNQPVEATVANFRALDWSTMKPNFYMIFSPGTLDGYPATYLTSFYLPERQKDVLNALIKRYPSTTLLEVDAILNQFKSILNQLTRAIDYLLYFSLLAGFLVLYAAVYATLDQRLYESALMRALGANRFFLRRIHIIEFGLLGLLAGGLTVILCESILYTISTRVFYIDYRPSFYLWPTVPFISLMTVGSAGYIGIRQVLNSSPLTVLRTTGQ
jgi:putative ABC transport system permease protein